MQSPPPLRVTIWHEFRHEKQNEQIRGLYPDGMHAVMRDAIQEETQTHFQRPVEITLATLDEERNGLTPDRIQHTDVMVWWGHMAHGDVSDEVVEEVCEAVRGGMGFVALHSSHYCKPFKKLLGTGGHLRWRAVGERERLWCVRPGHALVAGIDKDYIEVPNAEMYGEPFDIPDPDELVLVSWFEGGNIFRSGCVFNRGAGKIVYLRPGHEEYPVYYQPEIRRLLANAVHYAAPVAGTAPYFHECRKEYDTLETIHTPNPVSG